MNLGINAITYSLGSRRLSNEELAAENPQWDMSRTFERTGITSRPVAESSETALDLGEQASLALFKHVGITANDIDGLIFCTQTPDFVLPPNSTILHGRLAMPQNVMAFDINHACSGFIYGLGIGQSLIKSDTAKRVLLITGDTYTRLLHHQDRATRPIFGDGAAATLITGEDPVVSVLDMTFHTGGKAADRFIVKRGGARNPHLTNPAPVTIDKSGRVLSDEHIYMDGLGVLSFFTSVVPKAVREILSRNQLSIDQISLFIFHQASQLALDGLQKNLAISDQKMVVDIQDTGNLVSSSIPVALSRVLEDRRIEPNQLVLLCGFGVGLSWACALVRFNGEKV